MKRSLREVLTDSHVSAIAIAVLLFRSVDFAFWAFWEPLSLKMLNIVLNFPHFVSTRIVTDPITVFITFLDLFVALIFLAAAEILSRWLYGMGTLRSLSNYRTRLAKSAHV